MLFAWWFNPETHHYYMSSERGEVMHSRKELRQQSVREQEKDGQDNEDQDDSRKQNNRKQEQEQGDDRDYNHLDVESSPAGNDNDVGPGKVDNLTMTKAVASVGTNTFEESGGRQLAVSGGTYIPVGSPGAKKIGGQGQRQGLGYGDRDRDNDGVDESRREGSVADADPFISDIPPPTFISPWSVALSLQPQYTISTHLNTPITAPYSIL